LRALSRTEGYDAAHRIVRRHANRHSITRYDFDSEATHAAAQLRKHFVAGIALHTVESAGVDRDYRSLHVNQIVFAQ
jgi:YD repeat-containing protein